MKVNIQISSKQIMEDGQINSEDNKCIGEITYHQKGAVLEYTEKYEEQNIELRFKMTILENKIITVRNGQTMVFDLQNKDSAILSTPYGELNMIVTTNKINIIKDGDNIKNIHLEYEIELENSVSYNNIVDIILDTII